MRPRLESVPFPTSPRPTRVRPHLRSREESTPGPTRPRLESTLGPTRPRLESAPIPTSPRPVPPARAH
jgi:hypothetical protein